MEIPESQDGWLRDVDTVESYEEAGLPTGDAGNRSADDTDEALRILEDGFKHIVWADAGTDEVGQKAREPFWDRDESMPEFVEQAIRKALRSGAIQTISDELPAGTTRADVESFFREQLSQPQGWSLRSLAENYADRFDVDVSKAIDNVRTQVAGVLNDAREQGYREQGDTDDREFKWIGPDDDDTTAACEFIKQRTNPDHDGEPVTLDELKTIVQQANDAFFPDFDGSEFVPHWSCRHTFVEHFSS